MSEDNTECTIRNFVNLDTNNEFTPTMWRNAKFEKPNEDGTVRVITVDLFIKGEWMPYGLSLDDPYCPFEKEKIFQQIVDSGECKCYIPPTPEEILHREREMMSLERFQFKAQLAEMDLLESVRSAISNGTPTIKVVYEDASQFTRLSNIIEYLKTSVPLTDEQLDFIFREGAKIKV